jgi:hypothetical protein
MLLNRFLFPQHIFATFGKVHHSEVGDCIVHNSVVTAFGGDADVPRKINLYIKQLVET